jgi:RNA polymerase sigma-70 factor, ECF subfamily
MSSDRSDPLSNPRPLLRSVYAYAAYRVGPGPDAEDVLSEVVERALRYRSTYDPKVGTALAWMIGIARRVIADRANLQPVAPEQAVADTHDFEAESLQRLDLQAALARLSVRDRELLALRYGADLKASQIADALDLEVNAVEVALHRALRRMRDLLEPTSDVSVDVRTRHVPAP